MKHAIALLHAQIETSEHNHTIAKHEGRTADADLALAVAADCRQVIGALPHEDTEAQTTVIAKCKRIGERLLLHFLAHPDLLELEGRGTRVPAALGGLLCADTTPDMLGAITRVHKTLGAPGNYGYGSDPGDTLMALYRANDELLDA